MVVGNLRLSSMGKMDLGQKNVSGLRPRLIWATITCSGRNENYHGPYSDLPISNIVAKSICTGQNPQRGVFKGLWPRGS